MNDKDFNLLLTDSSVQYLMPLLSSQKALQIELRKSGCNGFAYDMKVIEIHSEEMDKKIKSGSATLLKSRGVQILIKEEDKPYLQNSIIDYQKNGLNSRLHIENPQVKHSCGCGESFTF